MNNKYFLLSLLIVGSVHAETIDLTCSIDKSSFNLLIYLFIKISCITTTTISIPIIIYNNVIFYLPPTEVLPRIN